MTPKVQVRDLGRADYKPTWELQEQLLKVAVDRKIARRRAGLPETGRTEGDNPADFPWPEHHLLFVEHPHVLTLGKSGDANHVVASPERLSQLGVEYHEINRGGDITYHGPGQLVGYPILDLDNFFTDIHKYLRYIEEAIILVLKEYGIESERYPGYTGVWIDADKPEARKICAIGVRTSRWVTMHGFAFNVNSNLDYFKNIVPCGIDDKDVTSMQRELGYEVNEEEVKDKVKNKLAELFEMDLVDF